MYIYASYIRIESSYGKMFCVFFFSKVVPSRKECVYINPLINDTLISGYKNPNWGRVDSTGEVSTGLQVEAPSNLVKRWQKSNWQKTASTSRLTRWLRPRVPLLEGVRRAT